MEKCCGNCEYRIYDDDYKDSYCNNRESDNYGEFVDFWQECDEFESYEEV